MTLWTQLILAPFATTVVALTLAGGTVASAGAVAKDQLGDVTADSDLGLEEYNQAIKRIYGFAEGRAERAASMAAGELR